jgi:hypothetical protein
VRQIAIRNFAKWCNVEFSELTWRIPGNFQLALNGQLTQVIRKIISERAVPQEFGDSPQCEQRRLQENIWRSGIDGYLRVLNDALEARIRHRLQFHQIHRSHY